MGVTWTKTGSKTDTSALTLIAAASGYTHYITDVMVCNTDTTDASLVTMFSNTGAMGYVYCPAASTVEHTFKVPLVATGANKALTISSSVSCGTLYYTASGFSNKSS